LQHQHLHLTRFLLFNALATAMAIASYLQGWLDGVFQAYLSELSGLILLVFLYGLAHCAVNIWRHGRDLAAIHAGRPDPNSLPGAYVVKSKRRGDRQGQRVEALRLRLTDRIVVVRHVADSLIFLGLIGTVIGFILALSGIDPEAAGKVENVSAMVATLINGMSVALYTTLVGAVFYIWLIINYRVLVTCTVALISTCLDLGEDDAGA
jgi:hypothetical protein